MVQVLEAQFQGAVDQAPPFWQEPVRIVDPKFLVKLDIDPQDAYRTNRIDYWVHQPVEVIARTVDQLSEDELKSMTGTLGKLKTHNEGDLNKINFTTGFPQTPRKSTLENIYGLLREREAKLTAPVEDFGQTAQPAHW